MPNDWRRIDSLITPNSSLDGPRMGPVLYGTVICRDLAASVAAYRDWLGQLVLEQSRLSTAQALFLQAPALIQARVAWLGPSRRELPWLRLIEDPDAAFHPPFGRAGWMCLEVAVRAVDALAGQLEHSPFTVLAGPQDLEMSPNIRAMQVAGPSGEVLYLTQVKAAVKPFELPQARHFVDRLFIPVLATNDRAASLKVYELLALGKGLQFNTKLGAFNLSQQLAPETLHPVAVLQLRNASLIEIDQIPVPSLNPAPSEHLPGGIASVTFKVPAIHPMLEAQLKRFLRGHAGEGIELHGGNLRDWHF